jgi:hypothetical protein
MEINNESDDWSADRSRADELQNVSPLVVIAVNAVGFRKALGICEGAKE